jgi:pSer/pThr/pTyr-binding forkhead associated (FHA) protein
MTPTTRPPTSADTTVAFPADLPGGLDASGAAVAEAEVSEIDGLPSGSALLIVKREPNAGARFLLTQPVTSAGRQPHSDSYLDDVSVSRYHFEFRWENGQFRIVDVRSLSGTHVNREPVHSAVLTNGDEIQIGKFRLVFLTRPTTA